MSYTENAKRELLKMGYKPIEECEDDPDKWVQENVLELLEVFSKQGHSGYSAPHVISLFSKLANHKPLTSIMCTDDEWNDVSDMSNDPTFQNNRCSAVFKNGIDGKPYYIDAIVFTGQNGSSFTGNSVKNRRNESICSKQYIKIPFKPKTFYIDVIETEWADKEETVEQEGGGWWTSVIKDESQLKKVWKYYERQETPSYLRYKKLKELSK